MAKQHVQGNNFLQNKCNLTPFYFPSPVLNFFMTKTVSLFCCMIWSKSISFSKVLGWLLYTWTLKLILNFTPFPLNYFQLTCIHHIIHKRIQVWWEDAKRQEIHQTAPLNSFSVYNHFLKQSADSTLEISGVYIDPWNPVN